MPRHSLLGAAVFGFATLLAPLTPAHAQQRASMSVPDENVQARLIWSTLVALDNANRTGDYGVLHKLGSTGFQTRNSEAALSNSFRSLRERRVDVGRTINLTPDLYLPPAVDAQGQLRLRGAFEFRPNNIRFDLIYVVEGGGWRLHAISVAEMRADAPR